MEFKDKINQSVAAAVAKIMGEALHPNQQKLDVHEPEKDKLTADDFKKLRAGKKPDMKKEEIEIEEESHQSKTTMKHIPNASPALKKASKDIKPGVSGYQDRVAMLKAGNVKEEVEELDEVKMADLPSTKVQGRSYGASKPQPSAFDVLKGPKDKELKSIETEKKKPVNEEDAYDKDVKSSDKPHDKDAAKKRAQTSAVAARKVMSMSSYSASKKGK
jgi:hypothetical protein